MGLSDGMQQRYLKGYHRTKVVELSVLRVDWAESVPAALYGVAPRDVKVLLAEAEHQSAVVQ